MCAPCGVACPGTSTSCKSNFQLLNLCHQQDNLSILESLPEQAIEGLSILESLPEQARGPAYPGTSVNCKSNCLAWNLCQAGVEGLSILELLPAVRAIV